MNKPETWIDPEELAYPDGGFTRKGRVVLTRNPHNPIDLAYGEVRTVMVSLPDTAFSIPAKLRIRGKTVKGYVSSDPAGLMFTPEADPAACGCGVCGPEEVR